MLRQVEDDAEPGQPFAYAGVFDGHGQSTVVTDTQASFWR